MRSGGRTESGAAACYAAGVSRKPYMLPLPSLPPLRSGARVWVAFSGGLDSTALLHRLVLAQVPGLRAVHVHHGLQGAADAWALRARRVCKQHGVPLSVRRVQIAADDPAGPEGAARAARYRVLSALLKPGDLLVTAHHREDQAETVLLRALRGSGIAGLGAMAAWGPCGKGHHWRPLLATPRADVLRYAQAQGLDWIEDPHNADARYARSYLRHAVWPRLQTHWPQAAESLARLAQHAQSAEALLDELAALDEPGVRRGAALSVSALLGLSAARRRNLLRHVWRGQGWAAASADLLQRLEREVLLAGSDRQPCLHYSGLELRRYRDDLYMMPALPPPPGDTELPWRRGRKLGLPDGCGHLSARTAPPMALTVRFPRGGERLRPAGGRHSRSLKQLCQDRGMPVWVRERMPLLFERNTLVSVAGIWSEAQLLETGWEPHWTCDLPGSAPG